MNINLIIGNNIRERRTQLGLSQEKLAEFSNLSVNFISKLERTNGQNISIQNLYQIAYALQTDVNSLLAQTGSEYQEPKSEETISTPNIQLLTRQLQLMEPQQAERLAKNFLQILAEIK